MDSTRNISDRDREADGQRQSPALRAFTVAQLADRWAIKPHVVLALIAAGELKAINVAAPGAKRPHWRIMPGALEDFELRRQAMPDEPAPARRKKKAVAPSLIDPETGRVSKRFRTVGSVKAAVAGT